MMTLVVFIGVVSLLTLAWSAIIFFRNDRVRDFRHDIIDRIGDANRRDIYAGNFDVDWRWEIYDSVSYASMVYKFWKPLASFYPNFDFCEQRRSE